MSFLSPDDLDRLIYALLIRDPLSEDERRALILELASHRRELRLRSPARMGTFPGCLADGCLCPRSTRDDTG
jgi:hypothetical protein